MWKHKFHGDRTRNPEQFLLEISFESLEKKELNFYFTYVYKTLESAKEGYRRAVKAYREMMEIGEFILDQSEIVGDELPCISILILSKDQISSINRVDISLLPEDAKEIGK